MSDVPISPEALAITELIARAIRDELGEEVDAYAGFSSPEHADPINRAFRAIVAAILRKNLPDEAVLPARVSRMLLRVAERRLTAGGWDDFQVRRLTEEHPGSPDDWLVFLILSSRPQIDPVLNPDDDSA